MSRYPWRDTSSDIAGGQPPQWETPQGAQAKADEALKDSKEYTDEQNAGFTEHIQDATIHVTPADKANWNSKAPGVHTHANATPTVPGFMSAEDKTKLNGVEAEANKYVHPVTHPPAIIAQDTGNRFVSDAEKASWSGKAETTEATTVAKGLMSPTDKQKLNGIQPAAEVNQNAFSGVNGVVATSKSDTLQLTGGTGITITEDAATKRLTVTATGDATPGAHASSHITGGTDVIPDAVIGGSSGLMSGADAKYVRQDGETKIGAQEKADSVLEAANEYTDQKVGEIVIDDASLTQKGIVQLSSATESDEEGEAATPKAVNTVRQLAADDATAKADAAQAEAQTALDNHTNTSAATSEPHGMRIRSGKLEYYDGSIWTAASSGLDLTTVSKTYFVNASTGNDSNDGLSDAQAFKTISKAISVVPDVFNNSIVINVAAGTYTENIVFIHNKFGAGSLTIQGPSSGSPAIISGRIELSRVDLSNISLFYLTVNPASGNNSISAVYVRLIRIQACTMTATTSQSGVIASYTDVEMYSCVISNKTQAIRSSSLSQVYSSNATGSGNSTGLYADAGGTIIKSGTQPSGTTAEFVTAGGLIRS
ncbi:tail fiber protein [Paenibacillus xylanexedens]|uniref:phage tail protein n=1 Tax=Paenibacillus xylanexedens TaxID=528191 RepID=UPI003B013D8A